MFEIIEIIVTAGCIALELISFLRTMRLIHSYGHIFPQSTDSITLTAEQGRISIEAVSPSPTLKAILLTLNRYLHSNANQVNDYHLMRDVVERNRSTREVEIVTLLPFPQYIGLAGTMIGIIIGVATFVFGGGLEALVTTAAGHSDVRGGIRILLGGVAIAVATSACGLVFTALNSWLFKRARTQTEQRENDFLSWIQAELLPNIATGLSSALSRMTDNLNRFNAAFSVNADKLASVLANVRSSYRDQAEVLRLLQSTDVIRVVTANATIYDKLKNCTEEIGLLAEGLSSSRQYLATVREVTAKLDDADRRARTWERMGRFFEQEAKQLERRKGAITEAVGEVDKRLTEALTALRERADAQITSTAEVMQEHRRSLDASLAQQEQVFTERLGQMSETIGKRTQTLERVFAEQEKLSAAAAQELHRYARQLDNLSDIRQGIRELQAAVAQQSQRPLTDAPITVTSRVAWPLQAAVYVIALFCLIVLGGEAVALYHFIVSVLS